MAVLGAGGLTVRPSASELVRHDLDVRHDAERLRLRGLVADARGRDERPVLLMIHGSTYPSAATFALPVEGRSIMDALAEAGIDVWTLDLVGYGGSSRPAAMARSPADGDPITSTFEAVEQVGTAIGHLQER